MQFEYDPVKSAKNLAKHGIDFEDAQRMWENDVAEFITKPGSDEVRWMVYGIIDGKNWTAIVTYRDRACRLISVRRSRKSEVMRYEQCFGRRD